MNPEAAQRLLHLAQKGERRVFRRGTRMIHQGETGEFLYIVLSGRLRAVATNEEGREFVLSEIAPVDCVGEMALDGGPRSADVDAIEDSVCVLINRQTLLQQLSIEPELAMDLLYRVIARARLATRQASDLALLSVYNRLIQWFEARLLPENAQGHRQLKLVITQAELAHHLGCSREMINRVMRDLHSAQVVDLNAKPWILLKSFPPRW